MGQTNVCLGMGLLHLGTGAWGSVMGLLGKYNTGAVNNGGPLHRGRKESKSVTQWACNAHCKAPKWEGVWVSKKEWELGAGL